VIDEVIAVIMTFVFAALIQFLGKGVPIYAGRAMKNTLPEEVRGSISKKVETFAIDLSTQIYIQLGFVFGILSSTVSCIAYTIRSQRPIFAALGAVLLACLIPYWLFYWQGLTASELLGAQGKYMRVWKWVVIIVLCAVTLYARFFPNLA
jgi:hypothetical protein